MRSKKRVLQGSGATRAEHMRYVSTAGAKDDKAGRSYLLAVHPW